MLAEHSGLGQVAVRMAAMIPMLRVKIDGLESSLELGNLFIDRKLDDLKLEVINGKRLPFNAETSGVWGFLELEVSKLGVLFRNYAGVVDEYMDTRNDNLLGEFMEELVEWRDEISYIISIIDRLQDLSAAGSNISVDTPLSDLEEARLLHEERLTEFTGKYNLMYHFATRFFDMVKVFSDLHYLVM